MARHVATRSGGIQQFTNLEKSADNHDHRPQAAGRMLWYVTGLTLAYAGVEAAIGWSLSGERVALSAHIVLKEMVQWEMVLANLQATLRERFGIEHVTLQPEPAEHVLQPLPRS